MTLAGMDGPRNTMHNSSYVTLLQLNAVHSKTLQSQNSNNRLSKRMTCLLKQKGLCRRQCQVGSHTLLIRYNFTQCGKGAILRHAQDTS